MGRTVSNPWHRLIGWVLILTAVVIGYLRIRAWVNSSVPDAPDSPEVIAEKVEAQKQREAKAAEFAEGRRMAERCVALRSKPESDLSLDESMFAHNCSEWYTGADGESHKAETLSWWRKVWE